MSVHRGSCLCGAVRYEVRGEIGPATLCHCSRCRKASGTAYVAAAPVKASELFLLEGEDQLAAWESSPGKERLFCRRCGSPIFSRRAADPGLVRLRIGTLDTPLARRPAAHIWTSDCPEWDVIEDSLPRHPRFEPGR